MAFAKGNVSSDPKEYKRFIGVASVKIMAINPDKATHEKLFNTTLEENPNYLTKVTTPSGNEVDNARISFILKPLNKNGGEIEGLPLVTMSMFVQNRAFTNKDNTKVQVIDKYGNTCWVTNEDFKAKRIPNDRNGNPMNIDADYRAALVGEKELTDFIKEFLVIPNSMMWDNTLQKFVKNSRVDNMDSCICRFDKLDSIFKGDFSEIKDAFGGMPENKVRVMLGVRTDAQSGRMYQTVNSRVFVRQENPRMTAFEKEIKNMMDQAASRGVAMNTEYEAVDVHEYKVTANTLTPSTTEIPAQESTDKLPWE